VRRLIVFVSAILAAGCTSVGRLSSDTGFDPSRDSIVVFGLQPENYRINLFAGSIRNDRWSQSMLYPASFLGVADRGYVIAKVHSDTPMGIANLRIVASEKDVYGQDYTPCKEAKTLVFTVPKGKVVYLSDFRYRHVGAGVELVNAPDFERARRHVDEKFPALQGRLVQGEFRLMPTTIPCSITLYVPVPAT
jgi:hypothetical protein